MECVPDGSGVGCWETSTHCVSVYSGGRGGNLLRLFISLCLYDQSDDGGVRNRRWRQQLRGFGKRQRQQLDDAASSSTLLAGRHQLLICFLSCCCDRQLVCLSTSHTTVRQQTFPPPPPPPSPSLSCYYYRDGSWLDGTVKEKTRRDHSRSSSWPPFDSPYHLYPNCG